MEDLAPVPPAGASPTPAHAYPSPGRRALITTGIILTTLMTAIDSTIANTVLPQIRASVSASPEEILWVLTSFILAGTAVTPTIGWAERRYGRRTILLGALIGFTLSSMLCGIATGIVELVIYRIIQGATAAVFVPLSQAIMLDINPPENHARAMSIWGMGAVLGPILGPVLGGLITENLSWRWVFFINIPFAIVGFLIMAATLPRQTARETQPFDGFGFIVLVLSLTGMQMVLDRGPSQEWFSSSEIWIYTGLSALCAYIFCVHTFTTRQPLIHPSILTDWNYLLASLVIFLIGVLMFAGIAVLPTLMQQLLGYPVLTAGLTQITRGIGTFISMFMVGRLVGVFDNRLIIATGVALTGGSYFLMSGFSLEMDQTPILISGLFQGLGIGLIFIPLMAIAFTTIQPALRTEAASFYTLIRNVGSSLGISMIGALQIYNMKIVGSQLSEHVRPDNPNLIASMPPAFDLATPGSQAVMQAIVSREAAMVAYVDSFHLLFILSLVILPLLLFLRTRPARQG